MQGKGNLKTQLDWGAEPQVRVYRAGLLVATGDIHSTHGVINGKELEQMTPQEWELVQHHAKTWLATHPQPE